MPLVLSDREMSVLLSLSEPIDQTRRQEFMQAVTAELETRAAAGAIGEGTVHRIGRVVQRAYFNPPSFGEGRR
jgi:hypothetical protein